MAQQQGQGGGGGNSGGSDGAYTPIWIIVILFFLGWFIWAYAKVHIVSFFFTVNILEAKLISLFSDNLQAQVYWMQTVDPASVTWRQLTFITHEVSQYLRFPAMGLLMSLAGILYFSNVTLKFRRTHSMNSLREQEKANWSQTAPAVRESIIDMDIDTGPWAMALSPMEFAKKHQLLKKDNYAAEDPKHPGVSLTAGIKRGEAKALFTAQLGAYWRGYDSLPAHLLALCAVFAARANQDRDGAAELLGNIDKSIMAGKISFAGGHALLKKHMHFEAVQECAAKHAYVMTFMASLIQVARQDGVLASADFLWLKTIDRRMWYMLNTIGRQTPFVEVAGAFAHWKAECLLERKSMVPMVEEAIKALEIAVKEVKLTAKEMGAL